MTKLISILLLVQSCLAASAASAAFPAIRLGGTTNLLTTTAQGILTMDGIPFLQPTNVYPLLHWITLPTENGTLFPGVYYTNVYFANMASGSNTIFVVPQGYYANAIYGLVGNATNLSGVTMTAYITDGASGQTRRTGAATANPTNAPAGFNFTTFAIMNKEGDTISLSNTAAGLTIQAVFKLMPTNGAMAVARLFTLTNTPQLLYTCPTNRWAVPWSFGALGNNIGGLLRFINDSGGARTNRIYLVPPGSSPDQTTLIQTPTVPGGSAITPTSTVLPPGYAFWIGSDAADAGGQWVQSDWIEVALP